MTTTPIKVVIVDDHPLVRDALARRLSMEPDYEVIGEADEGEAALQLVRRSRPDVLVLDLGLPGPHDGIDLIQEITGWDRAPKIVVLTGNATLFYAIRCYRAGANAFINKTAESSELLKAVRMASAGKRYVPPELAEDVAAYFLENKGGADPLELLTQRELQVLRSLAAGQTNREIAERFGISVRTVDTHRSNLLRKLNLRNNADLARMAIHWGLV